MKTKINKLLDAIQSEGRTTIAKAESAYLTTKDTLLDSVDDGVAIVKKAYGQVTGTLETLAKVGITVSLIVAPVPTAIGLAVMWIMEKALEAEAEKIDLQVSEKKKKREFARVAGLLKKYGSIPQTAIVETQYLRLEINSETETVTGLILKGENKGMFLSEMSHEIIDLFRRTSPDKETRDLLDAYASFDKKKKSLIGGKQ